LPMMMTDKDPAVTIQAMLTAKHLDVPLHKEAIAHLAAMPTSAGVKEFAGQILNPRSDKPEAQFTAEEKKFLKAGAEVYNTLCTTCHGENGKGMPMTGAAPGAMLAPSLAGSKTMNGPREAGIYVLLHGLTGDID